MRFTLTSAMATRTLKNRRFAMLKRVVVVQINRLKTLTIALDGVEHRACA